MEYALYRSKNPTNAFEDIHWKITESNRERVEEYHSLRSQLDNLKSFVKDYDVEFNKMHTEVENAWIHHDSTKKEMNQLQEFILDKQKSMKENLVVSQTETNAELKTLRERLNQLDLTIT